MPADVDVDDVLADLAENPQIEYAYPAPEPVPPPQASSTPDYTSMQGYLGPAPLGIDADFSRSDPRTRGAGIRIVDLEYDWTEGHEDLQLTGTDLGGAQFPRYTAFGPDHGTAVFGQLVGLDNGYGVTGGVPDAEMYGISPTRAPGLSWQPGPALAYLATLGVLEPGDVVLLEQQTASPYGGTAYAPLEWVASVFQAIQVLTAQGVVVVSTGGNGNQNTDDPVYTRGGIRWFDPDVQHSGSIMVGAGSSTARERLNFSNYGRRFDLQAWGQNITTTGYCTLYCIPNDPNVRYTRSFSGTSGAGPIVTAAVVAVQSYLKATGQDPWTSHQIADLLKATGTPQGPNTVAQHIGPLPDLRAALVAIEVDAPTTTADLTSESVTSQERHLRPVVTLTAADGWGSGVDVTEYRINGGDWSRYDGPVHVDGNGERIFEYRSVDANGNAEDVNVLTFVAQGRHNQCQALGRAVGTTTTGDTATLDLRVSGVSGSGSPTGTLTFASTGAGGSLDIEADTLDGIVCNGDRNTATVTGTASVDGGATGSFSLVVTDGGAGRNDQYRLMLGSLDTGNVALTSGDLTVR